MDKSNFITQKDITQRDFFLLPKFLFGNTPYSKISTEAKVLYGIIVDRSLNHWNLFASQKDENGNIYFVYPLDELLELSIEIKVAANKNQLIKRLEELDDKGSGVGLLSLISFEDVSFYINRIFFDTDLKGRGGEK